MAYHQLGAIGIFTLTDTKDAGFNPSKFDQDVLFMRVNKARNGDNYVGCHTDYLLIVARDAIRITEQLMEHYEISKPPEYHGEITVQLHQGTGNSG